MESIGMKFSVLLTCLVFLFGWASELSAQFVPATAKQRSVPYLIRPDGTAMEMVREESTYVRSSSYRLAVVSGALAALCLFIGLRGLLTRRPFLLPARWLFVILMVVLFGPVVSLIPFAWPSQAMDWFPLVMFPVMAVFLWVQMKGYLAFAVTGKSFRDGLLAALDKLQLPYEESLSSIRLTSVEADLQVAVQSWTGTGQIKVRPGRHGPLLKKIVQAMSDYFRTDAVETNLIMCVFFLILGIFSIFMAAATLFRWGLP
jgi:hypothetical protein